MRTTLSADYNAKGASDSMALKDKNCSKDEASAKFNIDVP